MTLGNREYLSLASFYQNLGRFEGAFLWFVFYFKDGICTMLIVGWNSKIIDQQVKRKSFLSSSSLSTSTPLTSSSSSSSFKSSSHLDLTYFWGLETTFLLSGQKKPAQSNQTKKVDQLLFFWLGQAFFWANSAPLPGRRPLIRTKAIFSLAPFQFNVLAVH